MWEIISRLISITTYGGLAHLADVPIRWLEHTKIRLFARYGTGYALVLPAYLSFLDALYSAGRVSEDDMPQRRRLLYIATSAYIIAGVAFGMGVVMAHVLEQLLKGEQE